MGTTESQAEIFPENLSTSFLVRALWFNELLSLHSCTLALGLGTLFLDQFTTEGTENLNQDHQVQTTTTYMHFSQNTLKPTLCCLKPLQFL